MPELDYDADGFLIDANWPRRAPPQMVAVPKFFDDCHSRDAAIAKMIDELTRPASIQIDGFDTMYRRLANALVLVLSIQGDLSP